MTAKPARIFAFFAFLQGNGIQQQPMGGVRVQMPAKIARSTPRSAFRLSEVAEAAGISRLLQEGRESANIRGRSGVIRRIPG